MLYTINPTHQQHRLQVEHVVFGDDAEHTSQPFSILKNRTSQHRFPAKLAIGFSQLQH